MVIGRPGRRSFACIGLERVGGTGDLGPEGLTFVPAVRWPNRRPLLIVGNEVSGTTAIFQVEVH